MKIGKFIARGGMAEVYYGEHTMLNRKVAAKIMHDHVDADPDNHRRFEREAQAVVSLRHPNIIQVFDYKLVDGRSCLVMELIPGASLGNYLKAPHKREEKLPFNLVAQILSALASAIDYAHSKNIIHRGIKPANALLRSASGPVDTGLPLPEDVDPTLTDFGLVRLLDASIQTSTGTVSGAPAYMSPEARGDKVTHKTDIYSLDVMLYEMLAGVVPFDAESSLDILMKHLNDYPTAKELADEFTAAFNGHTISADTIRLLILPKNLLKNRKKQARPFPWM